MIQGTCHCTRVHSGAERRRAGAHILHSTLIYSGPKDYVNGFASRILLTQMNYFFELNLWSASSSFCSASLLRREDKPFAQSTDHAPAITAITMLSNLLSIYHCSIATVLTCSDGFHLLKHV